MLLYLVHVCLVNDSISKKEKIKKKELILEVLLFMFGLYVYEMR